MNYQVKRVLCVDLDWTIRRPLSTKKDKNGKDRIFIKDENDIEIMPNVIEVLTQYYNEGWLIIGITNQAGVAYGYKTLKQILKETVATADLIIHKDTNKNLLAEIYMCPNDEKGNVPPYNYRSLCRKPNYGMLVLIENKLIKQNIVVDWDNSLIVGDMKSDEQLAINADIPFRWAEDFFNWKNIDKNIDSYINTIVTFKSIESYDLFVQQVYNPNKHLFLGERTTFESIADNNNTIANFCYIVFKGRDYIKVYGFSGVTDNDYTIVWATNINHVIESFKKLGIEPRIKFF